MSNSSADPLTAAGVAELAAGLMGQPVTAAEPINQGANNRVFRLKAPSGDFVMKFYFQHPSDPRDRLGTEFQSLSFLWANGIRQIPQPLQAWKPQACALYSSVDGLASAGRKTDADVEQAADFLKTLKRLTASAGSADLKPASEAFFSIKGIVDSLKPRLERLNCDDGTAEHAALRSYLAEDFLPLLATVERWMKDHSGRRGLAWDQELPQGRRTLSPCDFGFHNALRTGAGTMVFLDFEYFGWDDPVKMVADFLWHPGMTLTESQKESFIARMQEAFGEDPHYRARLETLSPLFGLKWCLIMLNEFVAVDMQRRGFAAMVDQDKAAARRRQLAKANALSDRVGLVYERFPYGRGRK